MPMERHSRPGLLFRWLICAASWIIAPRARAAWRAAWDSALENAWILCERGELQPEALRICCKAAFHDAIATRTGEGGLRRLVRSPRFVFAAALTILLGIGIFSRGFQGTRGLFHALPVVNAEQLVSIGYSGTVMQPSGVPPRLLNAWTRNPAPLTGIAGYWHKPYAPLARVTPNFFDLLGTQPELGRLFRPGDQDAAVLTNSYWRTQFHSDPHILGSRVLANGHSYTVVGVLPDSFWALSERITVWTPLVLEPQPPPDVPFLIGAVGRLQPGVSRDQLRAGLFRSAKAVQPTLPRAPEIRGFAAVPGRRVIGYLLGLGFSAVIAIVVLAMQQPFPLRYGWRYWRFFATKLVLVLAIPLTLWIETAWTDAPSTLLFLAACSFALWWSFRDQRQRCPECFEFLAMPVTIGSWSSVLEPVSTEFLCESGHGSLCVPETEQGLRDRWTSLDASWRELFDKVTPEGH